MPSYTSRAISIVGTLMDLNGDTLSGRIKVTADVTFVDDDGNVHLKGTPEYYTVVDGVVNVQVEGSDYCNPVGVNWTAKFIRAGTIAEIHLFTLPLNYDEGFTKDIADLITLDGLVELTEPSQLVDLQNRMTTLEDAEAAQDAAIATLPALDGRITVLEDFTFAHEVNQFMDGRWQIDADNLVVIDPAGGGDYLTLNEAAAAGHSKFYFVDGVHDLDFESNIRISPKSGQMQWIGPTNGKARINFNDAFIYFTDTTSMGLQVFDALSSTLNTITTSSGNWNELDAGFPLDLTKQDYFVIDTRNFDGNTYIYQVIDVNGNTITLDRDVVWQWEEEALTIRDRLEDYMVYDPTLVAYTHTDRINGIILPTNYQNIRVNTDGYDYSYRIILADTGGFTLESPITIGHEWYVNTPNINFDKAIFYNISFEFTTSEQFANWGQRIKFINPLLYQCDFKPHTSWDTYDPQYWWYDNEGDSYIWYKCKIDSRYDSCIWGCVGSRFIECELPIRLEHGTGTLENCTFSDNQYKTQYEFVGPQYTPTRQFSAINGAVTIRRELIQNLNNFSKNSYFYIEGSRRFEEGINESRSLVVTKDRSYPVIVNQDNTNNIAEYKIQLDTNQDFGEWTGNEILGIGIDSQNQQEFRLELDPGLDLAPWDVMRVYGRWFTTGTYYIGKYGAYFYKWPLGEGGMNPESWSPYEGAHFDYSGDSQQVYGEWYFMSLEYVLNTYNYTNCQFRLLVPQLYPNLTISEISSLTWSITLLGTQPVILQTGQSGDPACDITLTAYSQSYLRFIPYRSPYTGGLQFRPELLYNIELP